MIHRLNQTFVTPIDREDILELASALDDVVDFTEEVADYLGLYKIEAPMEQAQRMAHILVQATRQIAEAMPRMRDFDDISHFTVEVNRLENDGDRVVREAIASLFDAGIDPMIVIRWKDIFERLEDAIDAMRARRERARGHRDQERLRAAMDSDLILVIVVATALGFDFTNGFHDTANVVATSISTRAIAPRLAVALRGAAELRRRVHLAQGRRHGRQGHRRPRRDHDDDRLRRARRRDRVEPRDLVLRAAVQLVARAHRRPRGRRARGAGPRRRQRRGPAREASSSRPSSRPILAFAVAGISILVIYRIVGRLRPGPVNRGYRLGQLATGALLALSHGTNDAQKTMGIITLALVANGNLDAERLRGPDVGHRCPPRRRSPLGTYSGGWRIIKTMGTPHHQDGPGAGLRRPRARAPRSSSPPRTPASRCRRRT